MDYTDAALFARVVEAGSFTAAAASAGLPKSSVSRRVARLERDLGVRLMQRTTRKLTLTDAGQTFFAHVRRAVIGLEDAARTAREADGEPRGSVRATAPSGGAGLNLATCIAKFSRRYPGVEIELSLTTRVVDLVGEGFDIAVRAGVLEDSSLVARRVGTIEFALFAAPAYLRRRGRPRSLADLAAHDCVLFRARGGRARWQMSGPKGEETVNVGGHINADDIAFVAEMAQAGAGVALLPLNLAREVVRKRELMSVLSGFVAPGAPISVVLPSSEFVPSRVLLLRDALVEAISQELALMRRECGARQASRNPS